MFKVDDALGEIISPKVCVDVLTKKCSSDLCAEHAIGGIVGLLFNGLFADSELIALDGVNTSVPGGWLNHNWKQLYIQFAYLCAVIGYSFVMTALIAKALDFIPWLRLRATPEAEVLGMDDAQVRHTIIVFDTL